MQGALVAGAGHSAMTLHAADTFRDVRPMLEGVGRLSLSIAEHPGARHGDDRDQNE
jgi:hypothetical protein